MICQRQEILIFPELHQFMPYCHSPSEILMGIISHAGGLTEKVGVCVIPLTLINIIVVICKGKRWIPFLLMLWYMCENHMSVKMRVVLCCFVFSVLFSLYYVAMLFNFVPVVALRISSSFIYLFF